MGYSLPHLRRPSQPAGRAHAAVTDGTGGLCRAALPATNRAAQHGREIGARRGVTMRALQIFLVVIALVAVGVAGWALGSRGGYGQPDAGPAAGSHTSRPAPEPTPRRSSSA
jgi:hypothetical protein